MIFCEVYDVKLCVYVNKAQSFDKLQSNIIDAFDALKTDRAVLRKLRT